MTARFAWLAFAVLATAAFGEWGLSGTAYAQEAAQSEGGHDFVLFVRRSIYVAPHKKVRFRPHKPFPGATRGKL
jgi:hypothetical protein